MTHANRTEIQALFGLDTPEKMFEVLKKGLFAKRSRRPYKGQPPAVTNFTWSPWIYPHEDMWWIYLYYVHSVRNGRNADNFKSDFEGFVGSACPGCVCPKRNHERREIFESCTTHRLGPVEKLGYEKIFGAPIRRSSAQVDDIKVADFILPASKGVMLAPPPPDSLTL